KRVPKAKPAVTEPKGPGASRKKIDGAEPSAKPARKKAAVLEPEEPLATQPAEELKPAATLFRHTAAAGPVEAAPATPLSPAPAPIVPAPSALPSAPASPAPVRPTTVTPTTVTPTIGTPATKPAAPRPEPTPPEPPVEIKRELIKVPESVTVGELAAAMRRKSGEVIKALLELGVMATVNEVLDPTAAKLAADKFHFDVEVRSL